MTTYLVNLWGAVVALLPVLLFLAGLVLLALVLDGNSTEDKW